MLTKDQITQHQQIITTSLLSTNRPGMEGLLLYLNDGGFFTCPGSTKFHGCYEGGLAHHSLNVYDLLLAMNKDLALNCPADSLIIAPLLHDLCKMGSYIGTSKPYTYNRSHPKGHALLSLERIRQYITLTELEDKMIRYHMGVYGLKEFEPDKGEYTLRGESMANAWFHHPIVKVMYFCDELATLQEKTHETNPEP
jgi:23S rRNA maturation-related 3'-5' exoribonuclease YhaM